MKPKNKRSAYHLVAEEARAEERLRNYRQAYGLWTTASSLAVDETNRVWADARSEYCRRRMSLVSK
ncbi:ANR family transcriptional regulator [Buttiauxella selenatireducens]|uniref:ANR family transcriptional regulator n=1 Tax=Buttiauxella selenatireducens TaxID=3073902 RepID=A0ABY9SEY2_9ENTR|nr:ANR family transcriptional regulator [Buttiauxella sp. R73]WMY76069.1 ANR family transcriptional regulator [Buttiauxella sp. R73]